MPSYNYRCKDCKAENVYTVGENQSLPKGDVYCEACGSPRMELLEFSETEDLQNKKICEEIQSLHERIELLIKNVEEIRKRIEELEENTLSDFLEIDANLVN